VKLLVLGSNRSGTTLLWKSINALYPTPNFSIASLYSNSCLTEPKDNACIYYSLPSFSSSAISFHSQSEADTSFSSHFNFELNLSKLPANCIVRINQLTPECLSLLDIFDHVFVVTRSEESLLLSNLLDLPPAFEALSLARVSRVDLAKACALDRYWLQCLHHYIRSQESIIELLKLYTSKLSVIDFETLVSEHTSTLTRFSKRLGLSCSPSSLSDISSSLLFRSQSRWSSHYRDSTNNSPDSKPSLKELLSGGADITDSPSFLHLLASYKKFLFCGEFRYPYFQSPVFTESFNLKFSYRIDKLRMPIYASLAFVS